MYSYKHDVLTQVIHKETQLFASYPGKKTFFFFAFSDEETVYFSSNIRHIMHYFLDNYALTICNDKDE